MYNLKKELKKKNYSNAILKNFPIKKFSLLVGLLSLPAKPRNGMEKYFYAASTNDQQIHVPIGRQLSILDLVDSHEGACDPGPR